MIKLFLELSHFFNKVCLKPKFSVTFTFDTEGSARTAAIAFSEHVLSSAVSFSNDTRCRDGYIRKIAGIDVTFAWREQVVTIKAGEV